MICNSSELVRYRIVTPNRPEATCFIADLFETPDPSGLNLIGSSPPSPVLDFPPNSFIAIAKDSCDSVEIDPKLIAPVANLFTISFSLSTSSILIGFKGLLNFKRPLRELCLVETSFACLAKSQ